jgi:prepilin-type N-terminal cleavage/methylation domain-containing protein
MSKVSGIKRVRSRRGYTLIEMLLVLALLVVIASMAAPALNGVMQRAKLTSAGDSVRVDLTRAHVKAMKTGRIQVFRYELGGRMYRLQPWIGGDDDLETNLPDSTAGEGLGMSNVQGSPSADTGEDKELPEGTTFVAGEAAEESRGMAVSEAAAGDMSGGGNWSPPILFYPDGSSSDAYIVVADEFERGMRISVSGLTGSTTVGPVAPLDTLIQQ